MAARKMTFTLPEPLAIHFAKRVPARDRSAFVAKAVAERLAAQEQRLIQACDVANATADVAEIERDFDAIEDPIAEPWTDER